MCKFPGDRLAGGGLAFSRANHEPSIGRNSGADQRLGEKVANPVLKKGMNHVTKCYKTF